MNFGYKTHLLSTADNFVQLLLPALEGDFYFFSLFLSKSSFYLEHAIILSHKRIMQVLSGLVDLVCWWANDKIDCQTSNINSLSPSYPIFKSNWVWKNILGKFCLFISLSSLITFHSTFCWCTLIKDMKEKLATGFIYGWLTVHWEFLDLTQQNMYKASLNLPEDNWFESSREKVQAETWGRVKTERGFLLGQILLIF